MTFEDAIEFVRKTMQKDVALRNSYHSNIATRIYETSHSSESPCYDKFDPHSIDACEADYAADQIMDLLFDIPLND